LIFDFVVTCSRGWNETSCTGWIGKDWHLPIHMLFLQMLLMQSEAFLQAIVLLHFRHIMPPQSTSVSSWFLILSLHVSGAEESEVTMLEILRS
jgi:hypothetical protein